MTSVDDYLCTVNRIKNIAIFASGNGTNAEKIMEFFKENSCGRVAAVFCNRENAGVLERAERFGIPQVVFSKEELFNSTKVLDALKSHHIDVIALAGFLLLIPQSILEAYPGSIVNLHPSLLPKYGGKGMYGARVHEAVKTAGEQMTGMTIHLVDAEYDRGEKLFQARVKVLPEDSPQDIAQKVQELEHRYYPKVIEAVCNQA